MDARQPRRTPRPSSTRADAPPGSDAGDRQRPPGSQSGEVPGKSVLSRPGTGGVSGVIRGCDCFLVRAVAHNHRAQCRKGTRSHPVLAGASLSSEEAWGAPSEPRGATGEDDQGHDPGDPASRLQLDTPVLHRVFEAETEKNVQLSSRDPTHDEPSGTGFWARSGPGASTGTGVGFRSPGGPPWGRGQCRPGARGGGSGSSVWLTLMRHFRSQ